MCLAAGCMLCGLADAHEEEAKLELLRQLEEVEEAPAKKLKAELETLKAELNVAAAALTDLDFTPLIEEFVADYMPTHQGAAVEDLVEELARRWGLKPDKLWEFEAPPGVFVFLLAKALSAKRDEWLRKQLEARAQEEEMYRDVAHFTWCSFFQHPDFVFWWSSY